MKSDTASRIAIEESLVMMGQMQGDLKECIDATDRTLERLNTKDTISRVNLIKQLEEQKTYVSTIIIVMEKYTDYFLDIIVSYKVYEDELIDVTEQKGKADGQVTVLKDEIKCLKDEIKYLRDDGASEINREAKRLLELVESSYKSIAVSKKIKENKIIKTGNKKDINEAELIRLYQEGKLNNKEIGNAFGMSGAGIKTRLQALGVYRGRRRDYGVKRKHQ